MLSAAVLAALLWVGTCPGSLRGPVDAPVVDVFRLPGGPYQAGNRGLEYDTVPGQRVSAIGPGEVTFAGVVAGQRYVSIRHADGLVASFSFLQSISVTEGDIVGAGERIGAAGELFHLGIRRGGVYIDPGPLLGAPRRPRLVPDRRWGEPPPCASRAPPETRVVGVLSP